MLRYNVATGVTKIKTKLSIGITSLAIASIGTVGSMAVFGSAHAAYCDQSSNGCESAAAAGAQCGTGAGSGAFGAFGDKGDVTHDFGVNNPGTNGKPGADGHQTGLNNSALCGNRQGNL